MQNLPRLNIADQTADFLRKGIRHGRWSGKLPGAMKLAAELGVSKTSLIVALEMLEAEGLVICRGVGKHREVADRGAPGKAPVKKRLRVGILPYEDPHHSNAFKQRQLLGIAAGVEAAGHTSFFAPKSQIALRSDADRIMRMVESENADVWILVNSINEVQDRFVAAGSCAFCIGGRQDSGLPSCAYNPGEALEQATDRLIALGHRRISLISPRNWRIPNRNAYVEDFLNRLKTTGDVTGEFNVPDWTETPEGFEALLKSLFSITPPTALIVGDSRQAMAVMTHLAANGLRVGRDVSLVARIPDPVFEWARPTLAHFEFDESLVVKRVTRWLSRFAKGKADRGSELFPTRFIDGATVGQLRTVR